MSLPRFGVTKPVPVNLLMLAFLIAGLYAALNIRREFFPETSPDSASVTMIYPGATPEEVEQGLAIKIEDKLADLDDVKHIITTISEGGGGIVIEFREGLRDVFRATDEVQRAIDQLTDLPEQAERIRVTEFEPRLPAIMVTLYGDVDEDVLKRGIRRVRDDLAMLPGMGEIVIGGVRQYEVRVDVSAEALVEHGMSLPLVAETVRRWMSDVPGGAVRSDISHGVGNVSVRTVGVETHTEQVRNIVLRSSPDGSTVRVGDVATVRDDFVDADMSRRFNGKPAASLTVFRVGDQDVVAMAEMVRAYVDGRNGVSYRPRGLERFSVMREQRTAGSGDETDATKRDTTSHSLRRQAWELGVNAPHPLPPGTLLTTHSDLARFVEGRLELLSRNAFYGALLVFGTLLIFLNWRAAFWVGVGLMTAIAGTLVFMQVIGVTLNLLTMFGLIVVLGLLVDDAIVVAENIQARHDRGEASLVSAVKGADQVAWPVVATVLTSIVAFLPLSFVEGRIGDLLGALPLVVACALSMSLVESLLILPSHMGHSLVHRDKIKFDRTKGPSLAQRFEKWRDHLILDVVVPAYASFVEKSLRFRYISLSAALAVLIVSIGMVAGGRVAYTFLSSSDAETIIINVRMPIGTPIERTREVVARFEAAAAAQPETLSVSAMVGQSADIDTGRLDAAATHVAQLFIELYAVETREARGQRESQGVIAGIRQAVGPIEDAERINFSEISGGPGGPGISLRVRGDELPRIREAVAEIRATLATFEGVVDIADDYTLGQREVQISLTPAGASLGFTHVDVAMQVRAALFGIDAHVFAAEREDIDVRVRLDETTRRDLFAMENLWLIAPNGQAVPITEVAEVREGAAFSTIRRMDRRRAITVTADTVPGISPESIVSQIDLQALRARYSDLFIELAGRQEQQQRAFATLPIGFAAAMIGIYVILAWLFSSYVQPIAVMLAIPFGMIGVIWGHYLLGYEMTFLSMIGFVALSGIVVNDSLILVQFYNTKRAEGMGLREALVEAGRQRLRPIFLTTVTTVLGLTPLMLEQSFQAKFLIPMAIAIAFGLMSATIVILFVLPCILVIMDDFKGIAHFFWYGQRRAERAARESIETA
ncbi:MAG TPA: efflux RND transporter permease subunit [Phycisphaerales bacterium]|nr:efflux RND transporter permease subunit [Phycisphaerales bacterium]